MKQRLSESEQKYKMFKLLNENRHSNHTTAREEVEKRPEWAIFIQKFNKIRTPYLLKHKDRFENHDYAKLLPQAVFIDEYLLNSVKSDYVAKYVNIENYSTQEKADFECEGIKDPEYGDILVTFRGVGVLFKAIEAGENIIYKYAGKGYWKHNSSTGWMDIMMFVQIIKELSFSFRKEEVPVVYREKAPRKINHYGSPNGTGHKMGRQLAEDGTEIENEESTDLLSEQIVRIRKNMGLI